MTRVYLLLCTLLLVSGVYAQKSASATCRCDYVITASGSYRGTQLKAKPGQTVCIQAGKYKQLRFVNFEGAPGAPIRFINCGGLVEVVNDSYAPVVQFVDSQHIVLSGSGDSAYLYGFRLNNTGTSAGSTLNITGRSSDCELERLEVSNNHFAGIVVKQDPGCDPTFYRGHFTMYNLTIHDNYVHHTGGEGMYIGNSFWGNGVTVTCNGRKTVVYPHEIHGLQIHHNRLDQTGCEGIQYSCAPNASVHHNLISNAGTSPFARHQNSGLQIGGGSSGSCYNNIINNAPGNGLVIVGYAGDVNVYNNVITNIGSIGIFADERTGWLPNTKLTLINNTIVGCKADGIKLYSETSKNTIVNNVIAAVGLGRYITFGQGAVATQLSNVKSARPDTLGFVAITRADFRLTKNSFLVNRGSAAKAWPVLTDLNDTPRRSRDVGAYEHQSVSSVRTRASN